MGYFHEERGFPCLLGCRLSQDKLSHYADCCLMKEAVLANIVMPDADACFDCLGIARPSEFALKVTACMFYAYHSMKFAPLVCTQASALQSSTSRTDGVVITHNFTINTVESRRIFVGSFRASAFVAGLKCQPIPNETIPIVDGCLESVVGSG